MTIRTQPYNVLTEPAGTVYLNDPMGKEPEQEDKTEHQDTSENGEATSAPLSKEEETYKKRYDDLKTHYDRTKLSYDSQLAELKTQVSDMSNKISEKDSSFAAPKTQEEFKEFQEKYPELVAHIITAANMVTTSSNAVINNKLKQLEEKQNAVSAREGVEELKKYHPDFEQLKDDPRFHEWFNKQAVEVKNLIRSPNPIVIAKGLDLFKEYAGIKPKVIAKKDATRDIKTPTSRVEIGEPGKRTYSLREIDKMSMLEFAKHEKDIVAAQYDGRIVA